MNRALKNWPTILITKIIICSRTLELYISSKSSILTSCCSNI